MKRPSVKREHVFQSALVAAAVLGGATVVALDVGQALAYVSLALGIMFFAFAARYYVATISVLLAPSAGATVGRSDPGSGNRKGNRAPMVSVHLALYNEERVVERLLTACASIDYPSYEVVVVDDSKDGTVLRLKQRLLNQMKTDSNRLKIIHRHDREGFKGGALNVALQHTDPRAEFVLVLDADFVPAPDIINQFLAYFNTHDSEGNGETRGRYNGRLGAVQGYQWHTLNRSENWLTRGVSCEFSGSYMVDRTFQEVTGTLKMVAGSVYMIRAGLLRDLGWSGSLTEDWELTLRLYEKGYKVLYTPLIQAPAECPSTLGKLIRQRMRWAEGHTYNVKKHFVSVLSSPKLGVREKLEFLYFAPYYLQSFFLIIGTFFWLTSDIALGTKLPFLTAELGWGLVITNLLALPVMSLTGLFLERRARRDFRGVASQLVLTYALAPYQGYAALKGLLEPVEGSWARTFKSGRLAGFPGRLEPRKIMKDVLPPRMRAGPVSPKTLALVAVLLVALVAAALSQGVAAHSQSANPAYYFYDQPAPPSYVPSGPNTSGASFLMHLLLPQGPEASAAIGNSQGSGAVFFSDPAPVTEGLPFGASVSTHLWVSSQGGSDPQWKGGNLKFRIDLYDPSTNAVVHIEGAGDTEVVQLQPGLHLYEAYWGHIAEGKTVQKGETIMVTIWCPDCATPPSLVFNSPAHPSNIDFPIEVPENYLPLAATVLIVPGVAGMFVERRWRGKDWSLRKEGSGLREVQTSLIVAAALIFLSLPLVISFGDFLATAASATGFDRVVSTLAPFEAAGASDLLRGFGLAAGSSGNSVWIGSGFLPVTALIDWNCVGWQGFFLFGLTSAVGIGGLHSLRGKASVVALGLLSVFGLNVLRIAAVVVIGYFVSYPAALIFHDYGGAIITLAWLVLFWMLVLRRERGGDAE